jgi:hypothetical protein
MDKTNTDENRKVNKSYVQHIYKEFMSIFNITDEKNLIKTLVDLDVSSDNVCAKKIKKGMSNQL